MWDCSLGYLILRLRSLLSGLAHSAASSSALLKKLPQNQTWMMRQSSTFWPAGVCVDVQPRCEKRGGVPCPRATSARRRAAALPLSATNLAAATAHGRGRAPFCEMSTCSGSGWRKLPSPVDCIGRTNHSHSARGCSGDR